MAAELRLLGRAVSSGREIWQLLATGDPEAVRLTRAAGQRIGEVMATVVCLMNPEVVLISGRWPATPCSRG